MSNHLHNRILCVEDDDFVRHNAVEALSDAGFDVLEARDTEEALKLLVEPNGVDALFTDVRMPGRLDGLDLVEHVRREHPAMPVLVASGYAHQLTARLRSVAPPARFIGKPYSLAKVVRTLEELTAQA